MGGTVAALLWSALVASANPLLDAGVDPKAKFEHGTTNWGQANKNGDFKGTKACWKLNNARFE